MPVGELKVSQSLTVPQRSLQSSEQVGTSVLRSLTQGGQTEGRESYSHGCGENWTLVRGTHGCFLGQACFEPALKSGRPPQELGTELHPETTAGGRHRGSPLGLSGDVRSVVVGARPERWFCVLSHSSQNLREGPQGALLPGR